MPHRRESIEHVEASIRCLDLRPIIYRLVTGISSIERWPLVFAEAVASEYRRFLHLLALHPMEPSAPTWPIDLFWFQHAQTASYKADCESVFGRPIHRTPIFNLRNPSEAAALQVATHEAIRQQKRRFLELGGLDLEFFPRRSSSSFFTSERLESCA